MPWSCRVPIFVSLWQVCLFIINDETHWHDAISELHKRYLNEYKILNSLSPPLFPLFPLLTNILRD
jgi:hypothetical protein